ncbi:MAG: hypothetical protein JXQ65_06475 [Candidatus Marinimicrobia bacterium]|nr:hypothetical protein [Candidatus Neomarinimicrobiota bacterium]
MDGIETKIEDKKRYISEKLHLSPKPKTIETFKKFSLILPQISDYLVEKKAPLKVWEYLTILNENDQKIFLKLIKTFKPSMSNFLEIVENIAELIQLQKEGDIIHQIDKIINSNSPQPLMQIKETIVQLRYPVLSAHRKDILEIFANLQIPNNLTIHFDTNFEKKEIHGSFTICNNDDILKLQHFCREINIDNLKNILKKL